MKMYQTIFFAKWRSFCSGGVELKKKSRWVAANMLRINDWLKSESKPRNYMVCIIRKQSILVATIQNSSHISTDKFYSFRQMNVLNLD